MDQSRPKITVIVPTGNRKDVIEDCLRSVRWADELIVVDSFSEDGTYDIAEKYADRILQNHYGYSAKQKNWAIPQAKHEWILIVDTDERIPEALQTEIVEAIAGQTQYKGYRIPRQNYFLGKEIKHAGYSPDFQVRLFCKDAAVYADRKVHAHLQVDGLIGTLKSPMVHYAHRSLNQTISNLLITMTTWEAEQRQKEIINAGKSPRRWIKANILLRPVAAFWLRFIKQGGWRDGLHGLVLSFIWALYVAITYMKVWEIYLTLPDEWWVGHWEDNKK